MITENISDLLSTAGAEIIEAHGIKFFLTNFYRIIGQKLEQKTITETAAQVAIGRAEAICGIFND